MLDENFEKINYVSRYKNKKGTHAGQAAGWYI